MPTGPGAGGLWFSFKGPPLFCAFPKGCIVAEGISGKPDRILILQDFPEMDGVSILPLVGPLPFIHSILNKGKDSTEGIYG